jgi:hypothetical protein
MMCRGNKKLDLEAFDASPIAVHPVFHSRYFHTGFTDAIQRVTIFDNSSVIKCCG